MDVEDIHQVRSFNRVVSQRIGALDDSYLARGRPLAEARVLFEIGSAGGIELRALRHKLALDSGYLSRLLRSLETQGLIAVRKDSDDGRTRRITLSKSGRAEFEAYDGLSDALAESILTPLNGSQRTRLLTAMRDVTLLLRAGSVEVKPEEPGTPDARWCLAQYFAELAERFDSGFDPSQGNALTDAEMTPPAGYLILARLDGVPIGCGALKRLSTHQGEIKRVWVARSMRGLGVASRLMDELEAAARNAGFRSVVLDTNRALTEAHALYRKRGYREIARYNANPYAHHWFERRLDSDRRHTSD